MDFERRKIADELKDEDYELNEFINAIEEKNSERINSLITKEGILEETFLLDRTFLHIATELGTIDNVHEICNLGANVNVLNKSAETPIFNAIIRDSTEMIKILIDYGANVNITSKKGVNPLHLALLHGSRATLRLILIKAFNEISLDNEKNSPPDSTMFDLFKNLLKMKDYLNIRRNDYPLLIFSAAKLENKEIFQFVLNDCQNCFNASLKSEENGEQTERMIHCWRCRSSGKLMESKSSVNLPGSLNLTALHYAVRKELPKIVEFLLKFGADPNSRTLHNWTALHYAAFLNNAQICRLLLKFNADVNIISVFKNPLQQACGGINVKNCHNTLIGYYHDEFPYLGMKFIFHREIIEILIQNGVNKECRNENGMTPFLEACKAGCVEAVNVLLEYNVNIFAVDDEKNTALHYATLGNSLKIVDILLHAGLNVNVKNSKGYTPLMFVIKYGEKVFSTYPLKHPKHSKLSKNAEMVEYLIQRKARLNVKNNEGGTALHVAIMNNLPDLVLILFELGADRVLRNFFDSNNRFLTGNRNFSKYSLMSRTVLVSQIAFKNDEFYHYSHKLYFYESQMDEAFDFFSSSKEECDKLRSKVLLKKFTYYDFLSTDLSIAAKIVKNSKVMKHLRSSACERMFPLFAYFIQRRFQKIDILEKCLPSIVEFLSNYGDKKLPVEVVGIIVDYLCWKDIQLFSRVILKLL